MMRVVNATSGEVGVVIQGADAVSRVVTEHGDAGVYVEDGTWVPARPTSPVPRAALVAAAFELDRALCRLLGMEKQARETWLGLSAEKRALWLERGPRVPQIRADLYAQTMQTLTSYFR